MAAEVSRGQMQDLQVIVKHDLGTSLAVQWLRHRASTAGDMVLIPGRGTKILHATWHGQRIEEKKKRE